MTRRALSGTLALLLALSPLGAWATSPVNVQTPVVNSGSGAGQTSYQNVDSSNPFPVQSVPVDGTVVTGAITSSQSVTLNGGGFGTFGFQISGTWTGLIILEGTVDGTNWFPTTAVPLNSTAVGAFTANNAGQGSLGGLKAIRFRGNTVGSGSATITLRPSPTTATVMQDNLHWSNNVDQINGNTINTGVGASGTGTQRTAQALDTCPNTLAINQTASTDLVTSTNKLYICSIMVVSATQQGVSLAEGTGSVCGTGTSYLIGGSGGTMQVAANGGFSLPFGLAPMKSKVTADHLCLLQSSTGNVSGVITYADGT